MLQNFRDRIRTSPWLGYGIVIAIAIPFALLGIEAYVQGGGGDAAAEVNGTPIENMHVERQVSQRRAQLREQFGGELPNMFSEGMLREQVLDQLIMQEVLRQAATDARMRIGSDRLAARIRQQEYFQQDGQFNRELYRQTLRQAGLTPERYESQMRQAFRIEQLRDGITATAFALPGEARQAAQLQRQERRVSVLEYPEARAEQAITISPQDVRAYYEENRDRFQTPPQVRVAYLELDPEAVASDVEVTEDELRNAYRRQQQQREQEAERRAAHLLIEVLDGATEAEVNAAREEAERLRDRLQNGEADFAALAREHSDDPGSAAQGGNLGFVGRGTMVAPFERALFELEEPGAVSQPVRTGYGFHLIKLLEARDGDGAESFADAREQIEQQLRRRKAEGLFRDRAEVLRNTAYENPGSLTPAAEATGLEVQRSDWFSRRHGDGIADAEAVRQAAFNGDVREQGVNSGLLELGNRRVAVLRVIEEQPAQAKPLDAVRDEVRARLRQQRIERLFDEWSDSVASQLDQGTAPADLAGDRADYRDLGWIRRDDGSDAVIASAAFDLPPPNGDAVARQSVSVESGRAMVIVHDARLPEIEAPAVAQERTQRRGQLSRAEMGAWAEGLRAAAEVTRSQ